MVMKILFFLVVFLITTTIKAQFTDLPNPINQTTTGAPIASDYGPRNYGVNLYDFHPGIDYTSAAHQINYLVQTGTISIIHLVPQNSVANIVIGSWKYQHVQPTTFGNWYVYPDYGGEDACDLVITKQNGVIVSVYGSTECQQTTYKDGSTTYPIKKSIENTSELNLMTGDVLTSPHLHLQYNVGRHNPYEFIGYANSAATNLNNYTITNKFKYIDASNLAQDFSSNAIYSNPIILQSYIDYSAAKDLNEVIFQISSDNSTFSPLKNWKFNGTDANVFYDGTPSPPGGFIKGLNSTNLNDYEQDSREGIFPFLNVVSRDFYKYRLNSQTLSTGSTVLSPKSVAYPDGQYIFRFIERNCRNIEAHQDIVKIIDNFRPYIEKVEVRKGSNTGDLVYEGHWTWNGTALSFSSQTPASITDADDVYIRVYTSEPMQNVEVTAFGSTKNFTKVTDMQWEYTYSASDANVGLQSIIITNNSKDLAGNRLEGFTSTTNITSFPIRQSNGTWSPAALEQNDNVHKITVNSSIAETPTSVIASSSYTNKIIVAWNAVNGASYYNVYKSTVNDVNTATSVSGWISTNNYTDNSITGTTYYWVKAAKSSSGDKASGFSTVAIGSLVSAPIVDFTCSQLTYNTPYQAQIVDNTSGSIAKWVYDFGDGSAKVTYTTKPSTINHNYAAGNYTVSLEITDIYNNDPIKATRPLTISNEYPQLTVTKTFTWLSQTSYEFDITAVDDDLSHKVEIVNYYGDGTSPETVISGNAITHVYAKPSSVSKTYQPYATVTIKDNMGQIIASKNYTYGQVTVYPDMLLNLSIVQNTKPITKGFTSTFTANCTNASGNIFYTWVVNTNVNQLTGICNANSDANCYSYAGQTTGAVKFPSDGNYKVTLWASDQAGNQGYLDYVVNVGDAKDPCIQVDFYQTKAMTDYTEYPLNSELPLVDWATTGVYACYDASLNKFKYDGIKAIEWYKNGTLYQRKEYRTDIYNAVDFTVDGNPTEYYGKKPFIPCFTLNTVGSFDVTIRAYGGWLRYDASCSCYLLDYATGKPYSSVTRKINVVDYNTSITIDNNSISTYPEYTTGTFKYGSIICGGGSANQIIPSGKTVVFDAYKSISLKTGFNAKAGSSFLAKLSKPSDYPYSCSSFKSEPIIPDLSQSNSNTNCLVYPNPNSGQFTIEFKGDITKVKSLKIYSISGKFVFEKSEIKESINNISLKNCAVGIYIIQTNYIDKIEYTKVFIE